MGVLQGVRILDLSRVLAGPFCTRFLADYGAEVIKIEPPGVKEKDSFARAYYANWNRNKLAISLNLDIPQGIDLFKQLVAKSDVVVENFTPRVMLNWGLGYEALKACRANIIMLSMSAMGQTGPLSHYAGYGATVHALSGMTYLMGEKGHPPSGPGFSYSDHVAGLYGAIAVLGALEERSKTGLGRHIDLSETEAMVSLLGEALISAQDGNETCVGNHSLTAAPHGIYPCRGTDRWCAIDICNESEWQAFKKVVGNPVWADEVRFSTMQSRVQNQPELDRLIGGWTSSRTAEEVMELLQRGGVRAGMVTNARDLTNNPQLAARGFFTEVNDPVIDKMITDRQPVKFSGIQSESVSSAPVHAQHNNYIYGQLLGLSRAKIKSLRDDGII